ncbi:alpha-amylase [Dichomitus squalens LYAD-421 SS1]|uniref:alpha-amylase n=1 Tax=Dichomitus squalens (strain LYAD-421) TaxID=732165 RepID=UPI0004413571|nr:alpha-amylase [Dichomitus squalens LYAD-421 SS1]EJF62461.1 alpha-amylase [Dichomitus squalens LYAD-421 SS1]
MQYLFTLLLSLSLLSSVFAASADDWRKRSIYQVIIDRYALPKGADLTKCDPAQQAFCGGTWNTLKDNLDYIQDAGFTAVWISPVSQNYEGPRTPYGDPYHGYWIADASQLNSRFGSADDLKALSDELHRRGMYLMVDVVVNNVMGLKTDLSDLSTYMFKDKSQYHPYCPIQWGNTTSEQNCWLGDTNVTLPDVNTQDPSVVSAYTSWIQALVKEFNIDGLRIDAAKHVNIDFWPQFCGAAGVYCIGEVFDADAGQALQYQGPQALDAILNYPMYNALVSAFAIPGAQNMSALTDMVSQIKSKSKDPTLLGNFLEDQDVPRWASISVDPQSMWNAMTFNFMSDGIPIVYYGQEQGFNGNADPYNREPLWPSGYANTSSYQLIQKLNQLRNFMINTTSDWVTTPMQVLNETPQGIVISKGPVITALTNIGSPPANVTLSAKSGIGESVATTDILTCTQYATGSGGTLDFNYNKGGQPVIVVPDSVLVGSGICGHTLVKTSTGSQAGTSDNGAQGHLSTATASIVSAAAGVLLSLWTSVL